MSTDTKKANELDYRLIKELWAWRFEAPEKERLKNRGCAMSHHASGPNVGFPRSDARLDMADLYAFAERCHCRREFPCLGRRTISSDRRIRFLEVVD